MTSLGNLIRLLPLQLNELPIHTEFESSGTKTQAEQNQNFDTSIDENLSKTGSLDLVSHLDQDGRPRLVFFLKEVLDEATEFINHTMPSTFREGGLKASDPSTAKVRLLSRDISGTELNEIPWSTSRIPRQLPNSDLHSGEAWFARISQHENRAGEGTASFEEFNWGLRVDHSDHEGEYTPDVIDSFKVLDWDLETGVDGLSIDQYSHIKMNIYEMCHKLPFPLSPRVFSVLVITAITGPASFVIVQIPAKLDTFHKAFYSTGRNLKSGESPVTRKSPTIGIYTSIEHCKLLENQTIEWSMATASDAKGSLPMRVQKLGIPAAVAKDVGFFIKWITERRASPK